jgi:hypothetical protein
MSLCLVVAGALRANERLDQAWEEYHYKNWDGAARLFGEVAKGKDGSSAEDIFEGGFGEALVTQYRTLGSDPRKALGMYEALAKDLGSADKRRAVLHLFMGRACLGLKQPDVGAARTHFTAVTEGFGGTVEAREAMIELATIELRSPTREAIGSAVAMLEGELAKDSAGALAAVMHQYCGRLSHILGDRPRSRDHLIKLVDLGVPNMNRLRTVLFQIAYVSDMYLDDPETAVKYYQRLVDEIVSDCRKYYCTLRIAELQKGLQ